MKSDTAFVVYYSKQNRYSFNALVGALETSEALQDLRIYFLRRREELLKGLEEILRRHERVVVGFSFFTPQIWETRDLVQEIRKKFGKDPFCVAGGPHPTGDPAGTLAMGFDLVFTGEGEEALIEFFERLDNDSLLDVIPGTACLDENGAYKHGGRRRQVDLDRYPPFPVKHNRFGHIEITRGCPYACGYCQTSHIFGGNVRHRSVGQISYYVEYMKSRKLMDFRAITPDAFAYGSADGRELNLTVLEDLLKSLRRIYGQEGKIHLGTFPSEVRPEHVTRETIGLLLEYADNKGLVIGAQSGSERMLDACRRGHGVEDVYRAVRLSVQAGLLPDVDFIFGLPGETEGDMLATLRVMEDLVEMGARIHAHTFMPLPQTHFARASGGRVPAAVRQKIRELSPDTRGIIYGNWTLQERQAARMAEYLKQRG